MKPPKSNAASRHYLRCKDCGKRAKTYYDKEMNAVEGAGGYVTDCGTGGCGFTTGSTWTESRNNFLAYRAEPFSGYLICTRIISHDNY